MPYDTILWGEEQAANGLTGVAALAGQNHQASGDKLTLLNDPSPPILIEAGGLSDTKPQGAALVFDKLEGGNTYKLPAHIDFWGFGWMKDLRAMPKVLQKGDNVTGQISTTNVNEGQIVAASLVYGKENVPPPMLRYRYADVRKRYKDIFFDTITITSAAAVTFNSGAAALDTALTNEAKWLDNTQRYEFIGLIPNIGAATFGGIMNWTKLGGAWKGTQPGVVNPPLSAVSFGIGGDFITPAEPIPFNGDALPQVGMTATSAGAIASGAAFGWVGDIQ